MDEAFFSAIFVGKVILLSLQFSTVLKFTGLSGKRQDLPQRRTLNYKVGTLSNHDGEGNEDGEKQDI